MIETMSAFYYGHTITKDNLYINFDEGSGEITAQLKVGDYSLTEFAKELQDAFNINGTLVYTVSINRTTRVLTIAASGNFSLLVLSGTQAGLSVWDLAGFTTNRTGSNSYAGNKGSGSAYYPQYLLQSYISFEDNQQAADASVNVSTSGAVEVLSFGNEQFMECNIAYITNYDMGNDSPIETNLSGVEDYRNFMLYCIGKKKIEFIPDRDDSDYTKCLLESTESNSKGTGFKIKELYSKGLAGYFESGKLTFRKIA